MPWPSFGPSLVRSSCVFAARHFPRWPSTAACGGCSGCAPCARRWAKDRRKLRPWHGSWSCWGLNWWCLMVMLTRLVMVVVDGELVVVVVVDGWWLMNKGSWLKILGCVGTMCWDFLEFTWMVGECLRHVFLWGLVVDNGIERCVFFNW